MSNKVGMIVAVETEAIYQRYPDIKRLDAPKGFEVFLHQDENYQLFIMHCGMGTVLAAAGTQFLIDKFDVNVIIDFGVVGGLTEVMKVEKMVLIERAVHYRFDVSECMDLQIGQVDGHDSIYLYTDKELLNKALEIAPSLKKATIASGDKFVSKAEEKSYIHEKFDCDVCDMESSGIILTCEANNVPCLLFKAVSDSLTGGAEEFWKELLNVSLKCLDITDKVIDLIYNKKITN